MNPAEPKPIALPWKPVSHASKWLLDRLGAMLLMLLLLPFGLAISVWILVDDGWPIFFVQRRAGRGGVPFGMLKFRTMINNAVEIGRAMRITEDPFGIQREDPRITASGRFLRRTGLDEIPQLWNVFVGQMSLVGPRPDLVEQAANYTPEDRRRLLVLPGITGYSQVNGRDEIGWPERIRQDIWYIEHWSFGLDMKIALATFSQIFRKEPNPVEDAMNIERARKAAVPQTPADADPKPESDPEPPR